PEHAVGGFQDREVDVGADIEDADLQRSMLVGVGEERGGLFLLSRIERAGEDGAAGGFHFLHQRFELFAVAPPGEDGKAFGGEFLDDLGADIVAGADHGDRGVTLLHVCSPFSSASSLRGAKRRSNPCRGLGGMDCFASLAMTVVITCPTPSPRPRAVAPCRRTFPCRRRRSASRTRRARRRTGCFPGVL